MGKIKRVNISKWSLIVGLIIASTTICIYLYKDNMKLGIHVDKDSVECYDNSCKAIDYITPLLDKHNMIQKMAHDKAMEDAHEIHMAAVIAEIKENERLAKIEADRLAEIERVRLAEEKRLANLEAERNKRREEKKNQPAVVSRGSGYKGQWTTYQASYYTSACYQCSGIGASGVDLRQSIYYQGMRVIAADPRVIPLWSIVEIQGSSGSYQAIVLDTGGKILNAKIDVLVGSKDEAYKNGRHNVQLRILRRGK